MKKKLKDLTIGEFKKISQKQQSGEPIFCPVYWICGICNLTLLSDSELEQEIEVPEQ